MKKYISSISFCVAVVFLLAGCSTSKENYRAGAAGGVIGGAVGAGTGAAIGAGIKHGSIAKSAALGGAIGVPAGIAAGIAIKEYAEYSEEKSLQDEIDANSEEIKANESAIAQRRAEADDANRVIEVSPDQKRAVHTGPTLGNPYR